MILVRCCLAALFHCVLCWIWHFLRGWKNYTSPRERVAEVPIKFLQFRYRLIEIFGSHLCASRCITSSHCTAIVTFWRSVASLLKVDMPPNMECDVVHSLIDHGPIKLWLRIYITCVYLHSCTFIFKLVLVLACCLPILDGDNPISLALQNRN